MSFILKLLALAILTLPLQAKIVHDLNNHELTLPDNVQKVFGSSPPMNYLIYALNPQKMAGLNFKAKNPNNYASPQFLDKKFLALDVIGSFHGGGQKINLENLMQEKPDLILLWEDDMLAGTVEREIAKTKIPSITLPFRKVEDMPRAIQFAGEAIDEKERGDLLAAYAQKIIQEIQNALKNTKPTRYYYAEGIDGLSTECDASFHVEALNFAGGENVHKCKQSALLGLEKINFETLYSYNPEIIIVQNALVYNEIIENPLWQHLSAVKNKRVHLVPNDPFNWVDRPPSFMRIMGIEWLATLFHPKEYKVDLEQRVYEFYELYLNVKLSPKEIQKILGEDHEK
jgi:iron complex transport system substrate-binding protein